MDHENLVSQQVGGAMIQIHLGMPTRNSKLYLRFNNENQVFFNYVKACSKIIHIIPSNACVLTVEKESLWSPGIHVKEVLDLSENNGLNILSYIL